MNNIWAVGAVLHIMLTYEIPIQDQPRGLIARISKLDSLRPMDRAPISELLSLVVGECLSPSEKDRPSALQLLAVAMKLDCSLESYQRSESFWQVMATDADSELSSMVVACFVYKYLLIMAKHRICFSPKEIVLIMNLMYSGFLDGSAGDLTGGTVFHALAKLDELRKQLEAHASEEFESIFRLMTSMTLDHRVSSSHMARAMTESARHGYFNLARKLMEIGVNPSARGSRMEIALHISAWRGDIAMVRLLLGKGAEVDARDKDRRTPLQWASWAGKEETARELLSKNANVNVRDTENRTALYGAAGGGFTEVVRCLILHKADAMIRGGRGRETALERARNKKYNDVVALLSS
ncbi:ankyrin [Aspergillus niger CBS 101883]|uniref:Contig An08c0230, genomic contig n=4 Tax=Aspergillus niger TaxID=5061 RepID=A5AB95_ASPNC|nr:ankyrin [Aspergillus niger CBS 101883]XP_059606216.1 uncharacterized protein An08g09510 [Aspergillus niger]PYH54713.1 ankyrin [Aspergillus niger CBS 101883]RDH18498.1 ankyrin [Aspergillus niger ATCC 13496]CAK96729.1 unnamed protein product [Aspergillus niger]